MATPLDKDLVRESTLKHSDREILVTLAADQKISFKLKGMKSGVVSISIDELYRQLIGEEPQSDLFAEHMKTGAVEIVAETAETKAQKGNASWIDKATKDNPMVSLISLRSDINSSPMSMDTRAQMDSFLVSTIKRAQEPYKEAEARIKAESEKRR